MSDGAWWWCGLIPAERTGAPAKPPWAGFVEAALDLAPEQGHLPAAGLPWAQAFGLILSPFTQLVNQRLAQARGGTGPILAAATERLELDLTRLAMRTLVLELNIARVTGRLTGDGPAERFACFIGLAAGREALRELCAEYPVLARILAQHCLNTVDALAELLSRYTADREEIVGALLRGTDPGPLVSVQTAAGDGHRRGRTVAVLEFADGSRVVYKPRWLAAHRHFNDLAGWFTAGLRGPAPRTLRLLERPGYGWVEFIAPAPCADRARADRFYRRMGALLALLHALGGTDIHYENLIAHSEDPVLIDVETLFHPAFPLLAPTDADPAALVLRSSVHRTSLLPRLLLGDRHALDLSGLGGDPGLTDSIERIEWEGAGTDEMRLVRAPTVLAGAANRPRIDGVDAEPSHFTDALTAGFRAGYEAIVARRAELTTAGGWLHRFAEDEVRFVPRATAIYATLLHESTHPDVLRDAARRDEILGLLRSGDNGFPPAIVEAEIADLWDGDVPIFHTRPRTVDAWDSRGGRIPGVFATTGLAAAVSTVEAMGQADRSRQEWIIRAALASRSTTAHEISAPAPARRATSKVDRMLDVAERIGGRIAKSCHRGDGRVNWLGLEPVGERFWHLGPLGAALGNGYCGVALFLAQLDQVRGTSAYRRLVLETLSPVPRLLAMLAAAPETLGTVGSGGFAGLGGIAYALARTSVALDEPEVAGWAEQATALTATAVGAEGESGVIAGTAGGLAALLAVHRITGSAIAGEGAAKAAQELLHRRLPETAGFGHGTAGVGWALLRFGAERGDEGCARRGVEILKTTRLQGLSWCVGLPGAALAVAASPASAADPGLSSMVDRAVEQLRTHGALPDHSLCHGESGALALLGRVTHSRSYSDTMINARCGTPWGLTSPGMLTGLSGIGHGALHLAFPQQVPSVLLLE